ncbi:MAG: HAD-IIIA family hydrolase [Bacteroidetes bacterium]|nr:HAD-IIIA family hydrolase [Bacteroidota bacterium]
MSQDIFSTAGQATPDKTWTLFLDRDGVVNKEIIGSYVTTPAEFEFCPKSPEAIAALSEIFGKIIIVTNQRGVGRGLMSLDGLHEIHKLMREKIAATGGRIDKVYVATSLNDDDHNRKPNQGMALQAKQDFPQIDFHKSIMVGNSISDMEFGKRLGMHTVFVTTKHEPLALPNDLVDEQFGSLYEWAQSIAASTVAA